MLHWPTLVFTVLFGTFALALAAAGDYASNLGVDGDPVHTTVVAATPIEKVGEFGGFETKVKYKVDGQERAGTAILMRELYRPGEQLDLFVRKDDSTQLFRRYPDGAKMVSVLRGFGFAIFGIGVMIAFLLSGRRGGLTRWLSALGPLAAAGALGYGAYRADLLRKEQVAALYETSATIAEELRFPHKIYSLWEIKLPNGVVRIARRWDNDPTIDSRVGTTVTVRVDPDNPGSFVREDVAERGEWAVPLLAMLAGICAFAAIPSFLAGRPADDADS